MRYLLSIFFLFFCLSAFSQGTVDRIELGYATTKRGIEWTRPGLPTHVPVWRISRDTNAIIWHDKNTGIRYDWDYLTSVWYARGRFSSSLPPLPTQTSGLATIDNRTGFYLNASNILHRYDITQTAWVPLKITYQSAAPTNVASGVSNGAAIYTTTLWQDSDDFLIRYWDGDSWELIGGGTDLTFSGASSPVTLNSSTGTDVTFTAGTGISLAATGTNTTITNSAPDQTVSITGAGINVVTGTYPNFTVTGTEVDGSTSNELQTYGHAGTTTYTNTLSGGGGSWSITGAGIAAISQTAGAITVTATEVDGSISNEGVLGIGAGSGTSSTLLSTTSGANAVTINAAGILGISESTSANGGSITLTATEVDGSTTNELQTLANTSNSTSHTATLSNSGGSLQLVEGANITLTTTGTTLDGIVTIAGNAGTVTSVGLALPTSVFDISGSPVTSSGTLTATFDNQSANTVFAGPTSGGAATPTFRALAAADITSFATTGTGTLNYVPKWTPNGTTFGLSQIYDNGTNVGINTTSLSGKLTVKHTNGTGGLYLMNDANLASAGWSTTATGAGGFIMYDASQVAKLAWDGNVEQLRVKNAYEGGYTFLLTGNSKTTGNSITTGNVSAGTTSTAQTLHVQGTARITGSDGTATTVMGRDGDGDVSALSLSGMSISSGTLTATDGSVTNELQTIANTSNSTSHTATLSSSGGSLQLIEGAGVLLTTGGTGLNGTVTIEAIDPSTTNEIQTYSASGAGPTSYDMTVSSGGTVTLAEGAGIDLTRSGNTITVASTATSGYVNGGNSFGANATIGLNDAFRWDFETSGLVRGGINSGGTWWVGLTPITTAGFNISGLQNGIGMHVAGGTGLVSPVMLQTRGNGSGSTVLVLDAQHSFLNGNVEALIQNTSTSGTGGALLTLNVDESATGDPKMVYTTAGTTTWAHGIDNSASGEPWRLTDNSDIGSGTSTITANTSNQVGVNQKTPLVQLQVTGTDAIGLPSGTTAQRSAAAIAQIRHNNTFSGLEFYDLNKNYWYRLTAVSIPTVASNTAAGTGHSANVLAGELSSDVRGVIELNTGSASMAVGTVVTVTYASAYSGTKTVVLLDAGNDIAATQKSRYRVDTQSNTGFTIRAVTALDINETYVFKYYVGQ